MISHSRPTIDLSDRDVVDAALRSEFIDNGEQVAEFSRELATYAGARRVVITGSGMWALVVALRSLGAARGDEIILPTYVCDSVSKAIKAIGAVPVFCDVGQQWNMTLETVLPHVGRRTKAVIVVHIFGIQADMKAFDKLSIPVIEDCCQAFGAGSQIVKSAGSMNRRVFSFHATKCLTTGEGGAVAFSKDELSKSWDSDADETLSSITDMQAALGRNQLRRYEKFLERRQEIGEYYLDNLPERLTDSIRSLSDRTIFYRFPLRWPGEFDRIRQYCEERGVAVRKGVDSLLHREEGLSDSDFPRACELFDETVSIPIYPALSDSETNRVVNVIREAAKRCW